MGLKLDIKFNVTKTECRVFKLAIEKCLAVCSSTLWKHFHTVPHQRLQHKLESYRIKDPIRSLIRDFLSNRVQQVIVNGTPLSWSKILSGIPQESALGPILFIIFINAICESLSIPAYIYSLMILNYLGLLKKMRILNCCKVTLMQARNSQ